MKKIIVLTALSLTLGAILSVPLVARDVHKTAEGTLNKHWNWSIDKMADQTALTLSTGQSITVNYTVEVSALEMVDNWVVQGIIAVSNYLTVPITIQRVEDSMTSAVLDCSLPLTVPANHSLPVCGYEATGTGIPPTSNTVLIFIGDSPGTAVYYGSRTVDISSWGTNEVDECVEVTDSFGGVLGTVCAGDADKTFTYSRTIGPYSTCAEDEICNVATFTTNDTGATGTATNCIPVEVPCEEGCTLTPGYWKTHSENGPAPYDDTWSQLPGGASASTPFFLSGQSYYEVLWTPPKHGNAYYILAHAYIAAELNKLNGADSSAVDATIANAISFFQTYTPDAELTRAERRGAINAADILDAFNNGYIGPGHCSEEH